MLPWILGLAVILALGVFVARRTPASGVWWTAAALVTAGAGSHAFYGVTCLVSQGPSAAARVFSVSGSSLGLAGTALVARRLVGAAPAAAPTRTWTSTVALGSWYVIAGALRLFILLQAVVALTREGELSSNPVAAVAEQLGRVHGPGMLLLAIAVIVLGPIGEELTFRGLLLPALSARVSPAVAIAITSVLFGSLHWYYGVLVPVTVFLGAVLGWARLVSGGLRAPIALHMLFNALGFVPILMGHHG